MLSQRRIQSQALVPEKRLSPSEIETEGTRLLSLICPGSGSGSEHASDSIYEFSSADATSLLGYLAAATDFFFANNVHDDDGDDPQKSNSVDKSEEEIENEKRRKELYGKVVSRSLSMALQTPADSNTNAESSSTPTISIRYSHCPPKIARRILSNGILPLASSLPIAIPWADGLIRHCIALIVPTAIIAHSDHDGNNDKGPDNTNVDDEKMMNICTNTTALEILLPSLLARLHCSEMEVNVAVNADSSSTEEEKKDERDRSSTTTTTSKTPFTNMTLDDMLDALCCHHPTHSSQPNNTEATKRNTYFSLRPTAAAAVASSLKELESIIPNRLSFINTHKTGPSSSSADTNGSNNSTQRTTMVLTKKRKPKKTKSSTNEPVRIRSFLHALLKSLNALSHTSDWDSIPPLVYQSCLFVTKISSGEKSQKKSGGDEEYCYLVLSGIADFFHSLHLTKNEDCGDDEASIPHRNHSELEALSWAFHTSLTHLSTLLRSDTILPKALLKLLKAQTPPTAVTTAHTITNYHNLPPFRYQQITPIKLAMGLTMAYTIPRLRSNTLECLRDIVLEEELIGMKRLSSDWFNACTAILITGIDSISEQGSDDDDPDGEVLKREVQKFGTLRNEDTTYDDFRGRSSDIGLPSSHMLDCMKKLISIVVCDTPRDPHGSRSNGVSDAESSALLQSLVSLGFLLIDTVKKDAIAERQTSLIQSGSGAFILPPMPSCASMSGQNSTTTLQQKATWSASRIGRKLLAHLFVKIGWKPDDGIFDNSNNHTDTNIASSSLCRSILLTTSEKFCGMAPNALAHSHLLSEIIKYRIQDHSVAVMDSADNAGTDVLCEEYLPLIIDFLSGVPGGGTPPSVAMTSIIPSLGKIFKRSLMKIKRNRCKRSELEDQIDHCFILAKKALFCTDTQRRCVAINMLVVLFEIVLKVKHEDATHQTNNLGESPLIDEIKGYLRRCLTQHQAEVRLEIYLSLTTVVTSSDDNGASMHTSHSSSERSLPSACGMFLQILSSHLERYVIVEEDTAGLEARRRRAVMHGSQLSQCIDKDDEDDESVSHSSKNDSPLRLDMCISSGRLNTQLKSRPNMKTGKQASPNNSTSSLLTDAYRRINEPLPFLLGSISAMLNSQETIERDSDMFGVLQGFISLRDKIAASNLDQYLGWCSSGSMSSILTLSSCILIACVAETLMALPGSLEQVDESDFKSIEHLFRLRCEAIKKAATIASQQKKSKNTSKRKKAKNSKARNSESDDKYNVKMEEKEVQGGKSDKQASSLKLSQQAFERSRKSIEEMVSKLCPAMCPSFLTICYESCGCSIQSEEEDILLLSDGETKQDSSMQSPCHRLSQSASFRRFLLEKSLALLDGGALVVKAGQRFDQMGLMRIDEEAERKIGLYYIACSMKLGPLLFMEFISLIRQRNSTSLVKQQVIPLSQIAIRSFTSCLRRMSSHVKDHRCDKNTRITSFLELSMKRLFSMFPQVKEKWESLLQHEQVIKKYGEKCNGSDLQHCLLPFILPMKPWDSSNPNKIQGGIFSELICHGLDTEAADFCNFLTCSMRYLKPVEKQKLCVPFLECFNNCRYNDASKEGVIGLDHDESFSSNNSCYTSARGAVQSVLLLDGLLDGASQVLPREASSLTMWRQCIGFTHFTKGSVHEIAGVNEKETTEFYDLDGDELYGMAYYFSMAFMSASKIGSNFEESFAEKHQSTIKRMKSRCIQITSKVPLSSGSLVSKEFTSAARSLSTAIDVGLTDVEFVVLKIFPSIKNAHLLAVQKHLICRLYAICKIISTLAPCAEHIDDDGSLMTFLLKCIKRLYSAHTRLVLSQADQPKTLLGSENKLLLNAMSTKLNKRTMDLLLTMQEKDKVGDSGKLLAGAKIESHGRIAAQVVFEQERSDNALMKVSSKLKAQGLESDSTWLERKVVESTTRDFRIKEDRLSAVREREARKLLKKKRGSNSPNVKKRKASQQSNSGSEEEGGYNSDDGEEDSELELKGEAMDTDSEISLHD